MKDKGKSVLIIEDSETYRFMLAGILRANGIENIHEAKDGYEGVRMARYLKPDLVLLDLFMPKFDGYEVCKKIRLFSSKITMPIIVISGQEKSEALERVFKLGANDYLTKPFDEKEVSNRVAFYLDYCETLTQLSRYETHIKNDLSIARAVQENSLPDNGQAKDVFETYGLDFSSYYKASQGISGDYWDYKVVNDNQVFFYLFDVTGHGINAAINNSYIMSLADNLFKELHSRDRRFSLSAYVKTLNMKLYDSLDHSLFCAGAFFLFDRITGKLIYYAFGLPDFKLYRKQESCIKSLSARGLPMGVSVDNFHPRKRTVQFKEGDILLCMSDGLIEAASKNNQAHMMSESKVLEGEAFLNLTMNDLKNSATDMQDYIQSIIRVFEEQSFDLEEDDITMLALNRTEAFNINKNAAE